MCVLISPPKILGAVCHKHSYRASAPSSALAQDSLNGRRLGSSGGLSMGSWGAPPRAAWQEPHLLGELDDQRQLVVLDEVQQLLLGDLPLEVVPAFVELWTEEA